MQQDLTEEDSNQAMRKLVQNRVDGSTIAARNTQRIRDEVADGSKIRARKTEGIRDELVDGSKIGAREHETIHGAVSL